MIASLVLKGLRTGRARFLCAVVGLAVATGSVVFMTSLVATNRAQAPFLARAAARPWAAWKADGLRLGFERGQSPRAERGQTPVTERGRAPGTERGQSRRGERGQSPDLRLEAVSLTVDYRPGGHVLQGPPMRVILAEAPAENPYGNVTLAEGRWPGRASAAPEVVCVRRAISRFGAPPPALETDLVFVGREGTMTARVVGYLDGGGLPREFPTVFANHAAFARLAGEARGTVSFWKTHPAGIAGLETPDSPRVVASFTGDEQRRMDFATPLLVAAAFLTALALLVNSLLLSVESNRATLAVLRTVGLTRGGVVALVTVESLLAGFVGWLAGVAGAWAALAAFVACEPSAFPAGLALAWGRIGLTLLVLPVIVFAAALFALRPALQVRGMEAAARRPRPRRRGMAVTFACGFAAFVAVEVWGASLMRAFVPSAEWPDAIVSILPGGASAFDIERLRDVEGVRRMSELLPLQLPFESGAPANALFLAAEFLPRFRFLEGSWEEAERAVRTGDAVVITEMMSRAHGWHRGDRMTVTSGRPPQAVKVTLPVAGVVDLNWHMVTSRGLVRGMNGASPMTDGPVFCSFDTLESIDPRPAPMVRMTHLWVEYETAFLRAHGVFGAGRRVERAIAERLGNPSGSTVRLHARDEIADGTLAHGSDLIGQTARVPFVFLAILAIGFVAMLVAEAEARRREFTVLRAVGATRLQLAARLSASAAKTALAGVVCGFPVGALAGWWFAIGTGARWPGLPHYFVVPIGVVAEGALGALVFALLFAVPTALALVRARREAR